MSAEPRRVEVTLESKIGSVDLGEELARRMAGAAGFEEDEQDKISMAVRECLINALKHGNRGDVRKRMYLSLVLHANQLVVQVSDQGAGFDLAAIPDPLANENLLKRSGRGLFLVRCFMDTLQIETGRGGGALVTMSKRYPSTKKCIGEVEKGKGETAVSVKISKQEQGGVTVVSLSGRLILGEASAQLRDMLRELVAAGKKKIVLNLGEVAYIDSSGLGELVSGYTTVKNSGGELKLSNLTQKVNDLLTVTKLYTVFEVHGEQAAAVKSFS